MSRAATAAAAAAAAVFLLPLAIVLLVLGSGTGAPAASMAAAPQAAATISGGGTPGANQALGDALAAARGWTGAEATCLNELWTRESGWSQTADTRATGLDPANSPVFAYGIAQARPATKMPLAGQPPSLGGHADAAAQIGWGLVYIAGTYGAPCGAWAHEQAAGWY